MEKLTQNPSNMKTYEIRYIYPSGTSIVKVNGTMIDFNKDGNLILIYNEDKIVSIINREQVVAVYE